MWDFLCDLDHITIARTRKYPLKLAFEIIARA